MWPVVYLKVQDLERLTERELEVNTIPGSCTIATLGIYTWQGANYTFAFR